MIPNENRKERLIVAASERFLHEGFSNVSIAEIASDLGMSKKTFYKYFRGKEDLLRVVMDRLLTAIAGELLSIVDGDAPFPEKLDQLMTFLGQRLTLLSRPMLRDLQRHSPAVWEHVQQFRRERISREFRSLISRGVAEGYVRTDIDIDLFLMTFIGAVEAVVNPAFLAREPFSVGDVIRSIKTIFFQGILSRHGNIPSPVIIRSVP